MTLLKKGKMLVYLKHLFKERKWNVAFGYFSFSFLFPPKWDWNTVSHLQGPVPFLPRNPLTVQSTDMFWLQESGISQTLESQIQQMQQIIVLKTASGGDEKVIGVQVRAGVSRMDRHIADTWKGGGRGGELMRGVILMIEVVQCVRLLFFEGWEKDLFVQRQFSPWDLYTTSNRSPHQLPELAQPWDFAGRSTNLLSPQICKFILQ